MSKKEKKNLTRILVALGLFAIIFIFDKAVGFKVAEIKKFGWLVPFALYLIVYLIIGYDVIAKAFKNILHGQVFDENFLMCVATIGAFALAIFRGVTGLEVEGFDEACAVLLFYQVGEFFQRYATGKSRKSVSSLMDIRPDTANVKRDGKVVTVSPEEVSIGDTIVVNPGERIPLDGLIVKGFSSIDTKALTGESVPQEKGEGDEVLSGTVNLSSQLEIKVEKEFYDSTVSKILELVENASDKKSKTESFITKFSKYYTPTVCLSALLLAVIPSIITKDVSTWIYRALSFLVVSCPCALVISIPLSFFAGIGAAARYGILIKGSDYLEKFNKANVFVFDKTGTLTKGDFSVVKVTPENRREEILRLASIAEKNSSHPIAKSIVKALANSEKAENINDYVLTDYRGMGIKAEFNGDVILCGNEKLMKEFSVAFEKENQVGTVVYVAHNGEFVGSCVIADQLKTETKSVIAELGAMGAKTVMLTGDNEVVASAVAKEIGLTAYSASLLPQNKVEKVEKILNEKGASDVVSFVGDGINDAPVLMRSDIGIAMGAVGSDAAIEASDIVLMHDDLSGITLAKKIAKKTMRIVFENIIFSIGVKLVILLLSALGIATMWLAVFGDVGVAVIAILNAMRVNSKYNKTKN